MINSQLLKLACFVTFSAVDANDIQLKGVNFVARKGASWELPEDKCKTQFEIEKDLTLLKTMSEKFRLLSLADCDQGRMALIAAEKLDMSLYLGLWVNNETVHEDEIKYLNEMIDEGLLTNQPLVLGVTVGSEAVFRGDVTLEENIRIMKDVQQIIKDADLELPVSIAEIDETYRLNAELLEAVDFFSANVFPFWGKSDVTTAASNAIKSGLGDTTGPAEQAGKKIVISETGWPSAGFNSNGAPATPENSATYFADFYCAALLHPDWDYFYFTAIDNAWRFVESKRPNDVEGNFGIYFANGTMKNQFIALNFNCDGTDYSFSDSAKAGLSAIDISEDSTSIGDSTSNADSVKSKAGADNKSSDATSQSPLFFIMLMATLIEMMFT